MSKQTYHISDYLLVPLEGRFYLPTSITRVNSDELDYAHAPIGFSGQLKLSSALIQLTCEQIMTLLTPTPLLKPNQGSSFIHIPRSHASLLDTLCSDDAYKMSLDALRHPGRELSEQERLEILL